MATRIAFYRVGLEAETLIGSATLENGQVTLDGVAERIRGDWSGITTEGELKAVHDELQKTHAGRYFLIGLEEV